MRITKNPPWFLVFESQSPERNLGAFGFIAFSKVCYKIPDDGY